MESICGFWSVMSLIVLITGSIAFLLVDWFKRRNEAMELEREFELLKQKDAAHNDQWEALYQIELDMMEI